jgi:hypothetical protein
VHVDPCGHSDHRYRNNGANAWTTGTTLRSLTRAW